LPVAWEKSATNDSDRGSRPDDRYWNNDWPRYDWTMLPYQTDGKNWVGYWLDARGNHNLVHSECTGSSNQPCSGGEYQIKGMYTYSQIGIGWIVCGTGSGTEVVYPKTNAGFTPGTRCGHIMSKSVDQGDYYDTNSIWGFGIQADICTREGDSGGPLFSQIDGMAYGILSGGPTRVPTATDSATCPVRPSTASTRRCRRTSRTRRTRRASPSRWSRRRWGERNAWARMSVRAHASTGRERPHRADSDETGATERAAAAGHAAAVA
jgi:hypothetical protein